MQIYKGNSYSITMRVAIIGPVCMDENIAGKTRHRGIGGVAYYAGNTLVSLGAETTVFGTFGEPGDWLDGLKADLVHIRSAGTIRFINEYKEGMDERVQRAEMHRNTISPEDLKGHDMNGFDFILLGALFHDNITEELVESLSRTGARLILSMQGMIRHLEGDRIVWKMHDSLMRILPLVDFISLDFEELAFISGREDPVEGLILLRENGLRNAIVTRNRKGSWLFIEGRIHKIRAFEPRNLADPTGAGDTYTAGFIASTGMFTEPEKQGEFAAMVATMSMESEGAFTKNRENVIERLGW